MEIVSAEWLASLSAIVLIDLLLAGDNAVVIALAARRLPPHLRKKAVYAGTAGAILVRVMLVFFALKILQLPGLSLVGGLLLYWVAWRLLAKNDGDGEEGGSAADTFWSAMRTIIVADTVMGLDNILAIAGASRGDLGLVIFGFLLSIPIMVGGSVLILRWLEKAPWLVIGGCGLLALIAGRMILDDWWVREQMSKHMGGTEILQWSAIIITAIVFTVAATYMNKKRGNNSPK